MAIAEITELFKWMTIINVMLFFLSLAVSTILKGTISKIHSRVFGISEARVLDILYGFFGIYKIAIVVFNVVPYLALLIIQ